MFLRLVPLLFLASCQTVPNVWQERPVWSFIPEPSGVGATAHSLCAAHGGLFMSFGGIEEGADSPLGSQLLLYDSLQKTWIQANMDDGPAPRNYAALGQMNQMLYLFGGETKQAKASRDAYVYDPSRNAWSRLFVPDALDPRRQATLSAVGPDLVVFGGKGEVPVTNWGVYHPASGRWQVYPYPSAMPSRVAHAALGLDASRLFIWGGFEGNERRRDGFILDLKTGERKTVPETPYLDARSHAQALRLGRSVLIWEGSAGALFQLDQGSWRALPPVPDPAFHKVKGAVITAVDETSFLVFGGRLAADSFQDQLWLFNTDSFQWTLMRTREKPEGRIAHCFVRLEPQTFAVFGGIGYAKGTQRLTQFPGLWILEL